MNQGISDSGMTMLKRNLHCPGAVGTAYMGMMPFLPPSCRPRAAPQKLRWHEGKDGFHELGHVSLRDAEEESVLPWGSGHCMPGHDALFVILSQATCSSSEATMA